MSFIVINTFLPRSYKRIHAILEKSEFLEAMNCLKGVSIIAWLENDFSRSKPSTFLKRGQSGGKERSAE